MTKKKSTASQASPTAQPPTPIREYHPFADLLPKMEDREFEDLKKGIQASGLQEPITLYQEKVLDGRHRLRACQELEIEPKFEKVEFIDDQAALDFVIARNLQRRNLTASQKAVVALKAYGVVQDAVRAERIQKIRDAIAKKRIGEKTANLPSSAEPTKKQGKKKKETTVSIVGDMFGVSATYVRYAEALRKKDESLLDKVIVDGRRLYDLYKEECPDDVKSRTRLGRPADPIRTTLSKVIRLATASNDMPEVLKQLTGAMEALSKVRAAEKKAQEDAAKVAKDARAAKKPAPAAPKGKKPAKKAPGTKAPGKHSVDAGAETDADRTKPAEG